MADELQANVRDYVLGFMDVLTPLQAVRGWLEADPCMIDPVKMGGHLGERQSALCLAERLEQPRLMNQL